MKYSYRVESDGSWLIADGADVMWMPGADRVTAAATAAQYQRDADAPRRDMLDQMRVRWLDLISAERDRRIALGCSIDFGGGMTFTADTRNDTDFRNINGLVTYAVAEQAAGRGAEATIPFRDAANVTHILTPDQVVALGRAVSQRVALIYATSWGIKEAVAGAPDQAALDAIDISQGWLE